MNGLRSILFSIVLIITTLVVVAQPSGYVPGTFVNWPYNSHDHGFGKSDRFDAVPDSLKRVLLHWCGIGEVSFSNAYDQAPGKYLQDAGTNWNMKVVRANGDTIQFMVVTFFNYAGYYPPTHRNDIDSFFAKAVNLPDTSKHKYYWASGFSFGPGLMWGAFLEPSFPYARVFGGTRSISPTDLGVSVTTISAGKRNDVWRDSLDNNSGTPLSAANNLFAQLSGYKSIHKPNVGSAGHSADSALSIYGTGTAALTDSARSFWRLMAEFDPAGMPNQPPIADAGANQSINLPTTTATINGSASTDPDGTIATYAWTKISGPSTYTITSPSSATTTLTGLVQGVYIFRLTVTDNLGLTAFDDVQVTVSPAYVTPLQFFQVKEKPFLLSGPEYMMKPQRLVDGDTSTDWHTGDLNATLYAPFVAKFIFDSCMNNVRLKTWPRYGGTTVTFRFFNDLHTDSTDVTWTNSGNFTYNWVDTTTTKSIAFPVRSVEMTANASYNIGEILFYGNVATGATVTKYFPEYNYIRNRTGQEFHSLGGNGDEPASMIAGMTYNFVTGKAVWYNDTATSVGSGSHKFVFNVFGNNVLSEYQAYVAAGLNVFTYNNQASGQYFGTAPRPPYTGGGSPYDYYAIPESQVKNMPLGADSINPASWRENARLAAAHAIYYGTNTSANASGYNVTFSGGASATIGGGGLKALSIGNEIDADWVDKRRLHKPQVIIAMMSPAYDSAYAKDPNFEIWMGSQARPSLDKVKAYGWWSWRYRGYNNFPAKALPLNWYATNIGGQGSGGHGVSPEEANFYREMIGFDTVTRRYLGNVKLTIQEYGYDASPNTNYSAITIGAKSRRVVSADWCARAYLLARAAGIDQMNWFRSLDLTNDFTAGADFATSGAGTGFNGAHPDSSFKYWPVAYALGTLKWVMKNSIGRPQVIVYGDSTSYTILKDTAVTGYDTCTYYSWKGTSNGSSSTVTINAPIGKTFSYIQRVDFKYSGVSGASELGNGDVNGTKTSISPASSITFTATETPVMFRVVETSTGYVPPEGFPAKKTGKPRLVN